MDGKDDSYLLLPKSICLILLFYSFFLSVIHGFISCTSGYYYSILLYDSSDLMLFRFSCQNIRPSLLSSSSSPILLICSCYFCSSYSSGSSLLCIKAAINIPSHLIQCNASFNPDQARSSVLYDTIVFPYFPAF